MVFRMKKASIVLIAGFLLVMSGNAYAFLSVPSFGDTGWQTYTHTFETAWTGRVGFLVSNSGDKLVDSEMLVDNLNFGPTGNRGFENSPEHFAGYDATNGDITVVSSDTAASGNVYTPTENDFMARISSLNGIFDSTVLGGTNAAVLWLTDDISVEAGQTVQFDWAFLARDYMPFQDFAGLVHQDRLVTGGYSEFGFEKLAQIEDVVPEPATMSLFGLGLFGLLGLRKRRG